MMIGVGIIGAGRICGAHATAAAAIPQARLVGVAEPDAERRASFVARFGGEGFGDVRELFDRDDVDAVVLALPHHLHVEVGCAALDAGKHVLVEKPMAVTVAECDRMLDAAKRANRKLMIAHSQQYFPVNLKVRSLLASGELGTIVMAVDTWHKPFFGREKRPAWFLDAAKGGGMWPMNASHMIDRMTTFIGSEVVAVKGIVGNYFFDQPCTDAGIAILQFKNGVYATIHHTGYKDHGGVDRFEAEILCTEAQIRFTGNKLWRSRDGKFEEVAFSETMPPLKPDAPGVSSIFAAQMTDFATAILNDTTPAIPGEYGRQIVRVMAACEESGRTGREVRLD